MSTEGTKTSLNFISGAYFNPTNLWPCLFSSNVASADLNRHKLVSTTKEPHGISQSVSQQFPTSKKHPKQTQTY